MLNEEIMGYMLSHANLKSSLSDTKPVNIKSDISEAEALQVFNEIIEIYKRHDVSYDCACRLSVAMTHAMLTGAVELYNQDNP